MASRRKRSRRNSSNIDAVCLKQQNLLYVCGFCSKIIEGDEEMHLKHAMSHGNEITQCRTCCLAVDVNDTQTHLKQFHPCNYRLIRFYIDKSLIELRIATGKTFSNFWGICLSSEDATLNSFNAVLTRWWNNYKNGRTIGAFRIFQSKINWKCPICDKPTVVFNETISMRAYVLRHLEQHHFNEIMENQPGFLEFEWFYLKEETDFDVRALMHIARQRLQILKRSFLTFYTINLSRLENGEKFLCQLKKRCGAGNEEMRYCLVCCSLVPVESLRKHFRTQIHNYLESVAESTSFILLHRNADSNKTDVQMKIEIEESDEVLEKEEESAVEFPRELFLYSKVFKTLRKDEFKWRCCLCPRAHAQTFATQIIMRMHALRHIDQSHKFLFTEEFLAFEWLSIRHEIRASFDIRNFTPLQYTIKGEDTFNKNDPNDYMLPQQYYFLPKNCANDTVICGFCYRSLNRDHFLLHIVIHGFGMVTRETNELRKVVFDNAVGEMMGRNNYSDHGLEDEPCTVLSLHGKRLKSKMELISERRCSSLSQFSEMTSSCRSGRDTDGETYTPRKSAMDARKLLNDTFKVLQENARNRKDTWNESSGSSSSSSDEENSDDDRFEKNLHLEATTKAERLERSKSREAEAKNLSKMRPSEIREWIRNEARKKGIDWKDQSDSSSSSSAEISDSEEEVTREGENNWSNMKPSEIKELIREAAKRKNIEISMDLNSSSDSDG